MNNNNIVKIGTALKWRNTFDITKKYYQENIVTICGCVFRCKVLQAQGKTPVRVADDAGHLAFANTDVWDVIVDMAYYYNFAIDTNNLTKETLEYIKKLDAEWRRQQKEIEAIQEDDKKQWKHILEIEKLNAEQQREINSVLDTYSCFSEGIWFDTLLWNNDLLWDNNKYAITDDLQNQIDELSNRHKEDIEQIVSDIEEINAHMTRHEEEQNQINDYLLEQCDNWNNSISCFSEGVWENLLYWGNMSLWDNNKFSITEDLQNQIDDIVEQHDNDTNNAVIRFEKDELLINEHDAQLGDFLERFCSFSNGQWDNGLKWNNAAVWENSNMTCDTFEKVLSKISEHDASIANLVDEHEIIYQSIDNLEDNISKNKDTNREQQRQIDVLLETHSTINNGFWDNTLLWINESEWANRNIVDKLSDIVIKNIDDIAQNKETLDDLHENVKELERCAIESKNNIEDINTQLEENSEEQAVQDEKITQIGSHFCCFADGIWGDWFLWHNDDIWINEPNKHESRISELETSFMNMMNILTAQQKQLSEQQEELNKQKNMLETIMLCLSVISVGAWNNELLWYNEAIWSNGSYFDDDARERLTVKSYNEYGQEITLETVSHYYNENNQSLGFNNVEHSYQNSSETIDFK
jgi:hypothetical protein